MMRRLVERHQRHPAARHRREHLARHHRDLHLRAGAVLGARRPVGRRRARCAIPRASISASRCRSCRIWAPPAWSRRSRESQGRSRAGAGLAIAGAGAWWSALEFDAAPKIIARLPFVERADHPAGAAGLRGLARRARRHGDGGRDLERARLRLERGGGAGARATRRSRSRCRTAPSTARRCWSRCRRAAASTRSIDALVKAGASVRSAALVGSHATRYTVTASARPAWPPALCSGA